MKHFDAFAGMGGFTLALKNVFGTIKKIPKTQRYKMIGNSISIPVVEEIVKKLKL